jgi:hypothetical protein
MVQCFIVLLLLPLGSFGITCEEDGSIKDKAKEEGNKG